MKSVTTTDRGFAIVLSWLSAVLLVWTADRCIAARIFQEIGEPQRFTLVATGSLKNPRSTASDIWFSEVLVDGHHLLSEDIHVDGAWTALGTRGYHAVGPASASFTGRSAVVELLATPSSGVAKVRDSRGEAIVDTYAPWTLWTSKVHADMPAWTRPWWSWALFAAPALGTLALVHPWRSRRRTEAWLLFCCAAALAIVWCTMPVETNTDCLWYLHAFRLAIERGSPHHYSIGYGILMAVADALPGNLGANLTLLQHGMMMATLVMMWRLVRLYASWWLSAAWFFVTTWLAPTLLLPQNLLSENLALLAMVVGIFFTRRAVDHGGVVAGVLAGVGLGVATLTRAAPLAVTGPAMWLMFLDRQARGRSTTDLTDRRGRRFLGALVPQGIMRQRAALAFGTAALIVLTPMCWYAAHGHRFGLTTGIGRHFYNRIVYEQNLIDRDGPATKELQRLVPGVDLTTLGHWELDPRILDRIDHAAADALIAEVAKEALLTDPVGYLTFTFELVWRNLTSHSTGWLLHIADHEVNDALLALQTEPLLRYSAGAGTWAEYLRLAHVPIWLALCGLAVSSVVVLPWMPRGLLIGAFLWSMFGYMLACSAIEFASHRYNACITPFVSALAVVPLAAIDHALRRRRESAQMSAQPPTMSAVV